MANFAKRLEVVPVEAESVVTLVRLDMIDRLNCLGATMRGALDTQRVLFDIGSPQLAPVVTIATLSRRTAFAIQDLAALALVLKAKAAMSE